MTPAQDWHPRTYRTLSDIHNELDRFQQAHDTGTLRAGGNWDAGQILDHCGRWFQGSIDGINFKLPLGFRVFGRVIFKPLLGRLQLKPGLKQPTTALSEMDPTPGVTFEEGMAKIKAQLERIESGERMTSDSPLLGKMTHEKWIKLHLDHCRMHFGFIQCDTVGG